MRRGITLALALLVLTLSACAFGGSPRLGPGFRLDDLVIEPGPLQDVNDFYRRNPVTVVTTATGNLLLGGPMALVVAPIGYLEAILFQDFYLSKGLVNLAGYTGGLVTGTPFVLLTLPWSEDPPPPVEDLVLPEGVDENTNPPERE